MKPVLHKLLIVCCALILGGAHWAILQATAWTGMIVTRTQSMGVAEAVSTTFDGDHPCRMCTAISSAQEQEQQSRPEFPIVKAMEDVRLVIAEAVTLPPSTESGEIRWSQLVTATEPRSDSPPTPPPRKV